MPRDINESILLRWLSTKPINITGYVAAGDDVTLDNNDVER